MADSADNPTPTDTTTRPDQSLIDDVLRDAEALLADVGSSDTASASASPPAAGPPIEGFDTADVQALVDRVDGLLGDLGHLAEEVEATEPATVPGLDLTLVLPPETPAAENVVPDLGSAGPQVDLFSTPASPSVETSSGATEAEDVVLETEATGNGDDDLLGDLSAALAEEFDQPELTTASESAGPPADSPVSDTEVALMAAMAEEFGVEPGDLPPVEDEGDPFATGGDTPSEPSEAARRLEDLLAQRLAEEYDLVEFGTGAGTEAGVVDSVAESTADTSQAPVADPVTSIADATDLVQSDIDAVARAEIEALEALGNDLGSDDDDDVVLVTNVPEVPASSRLEPDPSSVADGDSPEATSSDEVDSPTEAEPSAGSTTPRPKPVRTVPSAIVRIGSLPFRVLPPKFHRYVTPVALSLAAWVPLAWGYAMLGPKPSPPRIDALPAVVRTPSDGGPTHPESPAVEHGEPTDQVAAPDGHHRPNG